MSNGSDRNFDDLTEKFSRKVYGGLKGDVRLAVIWRDLLSVMPAINSSQPIRVLDVGGGLGQMSVRLAELGHHVTYNDVSLNMSAVAKQSANKAGVEFNYLVPVSLPGSGSATIRAVRLNTVSCDDGMVG